MKLTWPWVRKPKNNYFLLALSILIAQTAGIIGSFFTVPAISSWYIHLHKPFFSPPNWLFGPVWILLYTLMGIAAYLVWRAVGFSKKSRTFWVFYSTQLVLNAWWSFLFFGMHWIGVAFVEILFLWWSIYRSLREGEKVSTMSSNLLYFYLAWVTFAAALNFALLILN